jgi:glycosyltransferase involved in cell wall biosynthesis
MFFNLNVDVMKTIVLSSNVCWSLYNFRRNLIKRLIVLNYKVVIVAKKDSYTDRLVELGCECIHLSIDSSGTNPVKDFYTMYCLFRIYAKIRPDFVLNFSPKNNIYSTLAASLFDVVIINNVAGLGFVFIENNLTSIIVKFLYKLSQKRADIVFFQNKDDLALFLKNNVCLPKKTDLLPGSGVDLARFIPSASLAVKEVTFLLVARMLYDKGVKYYVDAARELKKSGNSNVKFKLLGFLDSDNPSAVSRDEMNAWVQEGVVEYLGVSDTVEAEMSSADCIVLPSYYREGVPRSLLEAAALGKPIITTDSVGCKEVVDEGVNGYLCEPRSTESLLECLEKFLGLSVSEKAEMGANSRKKAEKEFDEEIVINKYIDFIGRY